MDREEILRKSQAEKQDEGKAYTFACGRKSGVIGMMCAFVILSVFYLYDGNKEQAYPLVSIIFAYLTCESIGIFYVTKKKKEIFKICIGLLTCIYFLILSLA